METLTPNYGLRKQDEDEFYTETINSDNMDIIDAELKKSDDHIADTNIHVTATKQATWNGKIDKSIFDAAGDLIYGSAANTPAKLAKGTDGQVLALTGGLPSWVDGGSPVINYKKIGEITTASGQASVEFANISTEYDSIFISARNLALSTSPSASAAIKFIINSDTSKEYSAVGISCTGVSSGIYSMASKSTTNAEIDQIIADNNSTNYGMLDLIISQIETNKYKKFSADGFCRPRSSQLYPIKTMVSGSWADTTARVASINFSPAAAAVFATGCKFTLYGGKLNV